jgi:membrane associated rhomboid family serine protease
MKTIFKQIPPITKTLILLSIFFTILNGYFGNINSELGLYQFSNENFNLYQILTFSFCHATDPYHLIYNCVYFLLFGILVEKMLGNKFLILILINIITQVVGVQFITTDTNFIGLSSILFSTITFLIFSKNNFDKLISFSLKLVLLLFIFNDCFSLIMMSLNNINNPYFYTCYLHFLGVFGGFIFYLLTKIKKGV